MKQPMVTGASIILTAGLLSLSAAVLAADDAPKWNPSKAELEAKNSPGQNWEGPHVRELMTMEDLDEVWKLSD